MQYINKPYSLHQTYCKNVFAPFYPDDKIMLMGVKKYTTRKITQGEKIEADVLAFDNIPFLIYYVQILQ